ncbi:hypothetical protein B566_EDAN001668 [Ephemera danica]|nr:hypothetical protein B566_EDAN001668 [Ephemera danica]
MTSIILRLLSFSRMAQTRKPKLIVFDLGVAGHCRNGSIVDQRGRKIKHFPEVPALLERLQSEGYELAVASRTGEIRGAEQLLELFDWNRFFTYKEIYPGCKKTHFSKFKKATGLDYSEMLFFDDEYRNIRDTVSIGVTAILVDEGFDSGVLEEGLRKFAAGLKQ